MMRQDAIRNGKFQVVINRDALYVQLTNVLPDYLHDQVREAYRFGDTAKIRELSLQMAHFAEQVEF